MASPAKRPREKCSNICAVRYCRTTSQTPGASLFRFPKDVERCKQWVKLCGCEYLEKNIECLYASMYRICHLHFAKDMYRTSDSKIKRLLSHSIPTLNMPVLPEDVQKTDHTYSVSQSSCGSDQHERETVEQKSSTQQKPSAAAMVDHTEYTMISSTSGSYVPELHSVVEAPFTHAGPSTSAAIIQEEIPLNESIVPLGDPGTATQTPKTFTSITPRKQKLHAKVHNLQQTVKGLKRKLHFVDDRLSVINSATLEEFKQLCEKFLPPRCAEFVKLQATLHNTKPHQRRYSTEFLLVCLKIYFMSPRAYRNMSNIFTLPTRRTLSRVTEHVHFKPGFNDSLLEALQEKVSTFMDIEKNCLVCLDEMSIKSHLFYVIGKDEVVGFEDYGEGKIFRPALNVLVVMVKGIYGNWKQPLAYFFVHNTCTPQVLRNIIETSIVRLKNICLNVRVVVNDMGSSNIAVSKLLNITEGSPVFIVDGEEIVYMFDVPHLIKAIRNNLMKHTYYIDEKYTSWHYVSAFYNHDKTLKNRLAPKLTDAHMNPSNMEKMKVKLATQVLSASVAAAMTTYIALGKLPAEAATTVEFIEQFDKLFDMLNSSTTSGGKEYNRAFKGLPYQTKFLQDALHLLNKIRVFSNKAEDITKKIKSLWCFRVTINAVMVLWDKLSTSGFEYLFTRRLCQDALENYFGSVRQQSGNVMNPTPIQFQRAFKKLFTNDFFNSTHQNCIQDMDEILHLNMANVKQYEDEVPIATDTSEAKISLKDCDYRFHDVEQNSITYICGYLVRKCLEVHSCDVCIKYANDHQDLDERSLYTHFRRYQTVNMQLFGKLYMPHDNFCYYIYELEQLFEENCERLLVSPNTLSKFAAIYKSVSFHHPCGNFPYTYLLKLYSRMRLFYCLKFINANFRYTNEKGAKIHRKQIIWRHA